MEYYRIINEWIKAKLWWLHSAQLLMYSVDFAEIEALQHAGDRDGLTTIMIQAAQQLQAWGADCILICTNTMHKMYDAVQAQVSIPLLHIADATAAQIQSQWLHKIALLGTKFTMEQDFYKWKLVQAWLDVVIPDDNDRDEIHRIIYDELCLGIIKAESQVIYQTIIAKLIDQWAQWVILWCTEIWLLITQDMVDVPVFDTTLIHAHKAVEYALI